MEISAPIKTGRTPGTGLALEKGMGQEAERGRGLVQRSHTAAGQPLTGAVAARRPPRRALRGALSRSPPSTALRSPIAETGTARPAPRSEEAHV